MPTKELGELLEREGIKQPIREIDHYYRYMPNKPTERGYANGWAKMEVGVMGPYYKWNTWMVNKLIKLRRKNNR